MKLNLNARLYAFALSLAPFFGFAQNAPIQSENWYTLTSTPAYKIEYRSQYCERLEDDLDRNNLIVRITNLSNNDLQIEYFNDLYYNDKCLTCNSESEEVKTSVRIKAGQSVEGHCDDTNSSLRHFINFTEIENQSVLTKFDVRQIKVSATIK